MMRRFYALLPLLIVLLMPNSAWADEWQDPETKVNYEYTPGQSEAIVKKGTGWDSNDQAGCPEASGDIAILSSFTINGETYTVTEIRNYAFAHCNNLTSVKIPNTINFIGIGAFAECWSLHSINIPESVKYLCPCAFMRCALTSIDIPGSVESIGYQAFLQCSKLETVTIGEGVTTIRGTNVSDHFDGGAFSWCFNLKKVSLPESLKEIGTETFGGCIKLSAIELPKNLEKIGEKAFYGTGNECERFDVYSHIEEPFALNEVFDGNGKNPDENTLYVPAGTKAKYEATDGWKEFKNIVEMESENKDLKVGDTFVAGGITYRVTNSDQKEVMVGYKEPYSDIAVNKDTTGIIIIPSTIIGSDESTYSVTGIQDYAFEGCNKLTGVIIPENITIGEGVFNGCSNLTNVNIPESLKIIQPLTFRNCSSLQTVYIPESVKEIGYAAFDGCKALNSVNIPIGITNIARATFQSCESLTCIDIPSTVTSIGEAAFNICGLKSIIIPEGVTSIGRAAFSDCWQAEDIIIPSSVTSIGEVAFSRGYSHLTKVTSYMTNPVPISYNTFGQNNYDSYTYATLYVPAGTKAKYEATEGWKEFKNIVEMVELDPIDGETTVSTDNLGNENLSDNIVNDIYYNVGAEGYDSSDKSVVISQTTNMGQITDATPGSSEVKENFNGMILKVAAGKGTITVNVKTTGNAQLVVQVGSQTPMIASKTEQGDVVVSYNVAEDTYVYIYAIIGSSAAPAHRAAPADAVKIYSIKVTPGATGIDTVHSSQSTVHSCYTLDSRKLQGQPTKKGVYIVNGRKVVVK